MRTNGFISIAAITVILSGVHADQFSSLWYDGNAEISTYRLIEQRYGEQRTGTRVMVFVTEPMRLSTHIKPDEKLPDSLKMPVIKLNDIREFTTGIYEYNVMTSVFAAVEARETIPLMGTMKVSFSAQDWCGQTFERAIRLDDRYEGALFSYFESEGEQAYEIEHEQSVEAEDNLWILVRELRGPVLEVGQSKPLRVIPSMWSRRKAHEPVTIIDGTLTKERVEKRDYAIGKRKAAAFRWAAKDRETIIWVEKEYPHRILEWQEPDGSRGTILASVREPYWKQHGNKHVTLRKKLELKND